MMDPHFKAMLDAQAKAAEGQAAPPLDALPPDMVRAGYRMQRQATDQNAPKDVETRDLKVAGAAGEIPARLYTPAGAAAITGGLVYRIAVGGDSAGGNLAASVASDLKADPKRKIAFQLLLYPGIWPDEETASRKALDGPLLTKQAIAWFDKCLAAAGHPQSHRAMLGKVDCAGLPPALVVTAGFDPLKDEGRDHAERLRASGVKVEHAEYPSLIHDFYIMADVSPAVGEAVRATAASLKAALA
ncbi:MAG: hypothetical protein B7Z13_12970 [Caulobacterales bacterium 32-67-6]|nr:MAG: hypothetical protein B7Z13_12970 [Caulobacterales bacterium 32-67-6]